MYVLYGCKHFMGLRVLEDGTALLQHSHRRHDYISTHLDELDTREPPTETHASPVSASRAYGIDCAGGKTSELAAIDILDSWNTLQLQGPEDHYFLEEPRPVRIQLPGPLRLQAEDLHVSFSEHDTFSDAVSEAECSESSGFWDPPFYDPATANTVLDAHAASTYASHAVSDIDRYAGASEHAGESCASLPIDLMGHLASFYFDRVYLRALAASSSSMLIMIRDKGIWQDLVVDIDQPDLQIPPRLRSMVSLLSSARWVRMNVRQLSMFRSIPANSILNWTLDGAPHAAPQPFMIFGCQSRQLPTGMAEFNIVLPREVTKHWR